MSCAGNCNLFSCKQINNKSISNLALICRVLLEPLLGLGGHKIPVQFGPKEEHMLLSAVGACQFASRIDRPSIDELQSTLRGLLANMPEVPPLMVPHNEDVAGFLSAQAAFEQLADGASERGVIALDATLTRPPPVRLTGGEIASQLRDFLHNPAYEAAHAGDDGGKHHVSHKAAAAALPPRNLTRWWFDFMRKQRNGHESAAIMAPPVRLYGYLDGERWASSPVYTRLNHRRLQTHGGTVYVLEGEVDCPLLQRHDFRKALCQRFLDGFPDDWGSLLAVEYERQFDSLKDAYFRKYAPKKAIDFRYEPVLVDEMVCCIYIFLLLYFILLKK